MHKTFLKTFTALAMTSGLAQAVNYPAGTVTFNGSVSSTTCRVNVNASDISSRGSNTTVVFPPLAPSAFGGINQGPQRSFDLNFSTCPANVTDMDLMFSGTADADNPQAFANSTGNGFATGVAVLVQKTYPGPSLTFQPNQASTNLPVAFNASGNASIEITTTLLQTTNTEPTPGSVLAYATVNMIY